MADDFSAVATSGLGTEFGTAAAAYNRMVHLPLRARLVYNRAATVRPTRQTAPGTTVTLHIGTDEAVATTPLVETTDPDSVSNTVSDVTVTLNEYGKAIGRTRKLEGLSYVRVDPVIAERAVRNSLDTLDTLARNALDAGTNTRVAAGVAETALAGETAAHRLTAEETRRARNTLARANAAPFADPYYLAIVHPDQHYDLRGETGAGAWRAPREAVDPMDILTGEVGVFEGFRFVESTNAKVEDGAGSGVSDVYTANMLGAECLVKAHAIAGGFGDMPQMVLSPVVDSLRRFIKVGWLWLGGYAEFRSEANHLLHTASSLDPSA